MQRPALTNRSDGGVESQGQNAREKRGQKHLSEDVLGFRRARFELTSADRFLEIGNGRSRQIDVTAQPRGSRRSTEQNARIVKPGERPEPLQADGEGSHPANGKARR